MSDKDSLTPVDVTGSTLENAIANGLAQLGLARNEVIIEIVEEGSKGILGMGSRESLVRLIPLRPPRGPSEKPPGVQQPEPQPEEVETRAPEPAKEVSAPVQAKPELEMEEIDDSQDVEYAKDALTDLLHFMSVDADINVYRSELRAGDDLQGAPWVLDIRGPDLGVLIGRRGETLNALQYIARLIVSRKLQRRANIVLDVEGYKSRRETTLRKLAERMADRAAKQGRTMTLEPMPPNERRIIHLTLRDDDSVTTESVGTGNHRKVTIIPNP